MASYVPFVYRLPPPRRRRRIPPHGEAMEALNEFKEIEARNRSATEVLIARLAVCRNLGKWELAEEVARTLVKREPHSVMHIVALAEVMG